MARLAQPGSEPRARHERGVVRLPHRPALQVSPDHDALHVVREDVFRHPHRHEGVDHADGQVLLPRVGEELDVARAAVVADQREARDPERCARPVLDLDEPPVHLVRLAGPGLEPPSSASLRLRPRQPALGGH